MIRFIATIALIALTALWLASTSNAHSGVIWYWSKGKAENKLLNTGQAANAFNAIDVWDADCVGVGKWIWSNDRPYIKLYKHFECFVQYTDYEDQDWEWERVLHVRGSHRFSLASV